MAFPRNYGAVSWRCGTQTKLLCTFYLSQAAPWHRQTRDSDSLSRSLFQVFYWQCCSRTAAFGFFLFLIKSLSPEHLALIEKEADLWSRIPLKNLLFISNTWCDVLRIFKPNKARLRTVLMLVSHLYYKLSEVERVK